MPWYKMAYELRVSLHKPGFSKKHFWSTQKQTNKQKKMQKFLKQLFSIMVSNFANANNSVLWAS